MNHVGVRGVTLKFAATVAQAACLLTVSAFSNGIRVIRKLRFAGYAFMRAGRPRYNTRTFSNLRLFFSNVAIAPPSCE